MKNISILTASVSLLWALTVQADLITSIPGPDDQGGMKMPVVTITGADDNSNPTTGTISISFDSGATPILSTLEEWSPGSWFSDAAGWRQDLGSPVGVGGTPVANAGSGDLFNNQYGFMFMANPMMGTAYIPTGKSLAIRLTAVSSPLLESFNYVNAQNRWDPVFTGSDPQVLWSGSMWHNYFTLPSGAPAGTYSATFEVFIADQAFASGTGFADYSASALAAAQDPGFSPASVTYTWTAVPEVSSLALVAFGGLVLVAAIRLRKPLPANV